ncbi:hypothetical protein, partial [Streptomyces sp. NPDC002619]|uniref:hypothetical protein n=1 Tax=Streptomyces sp. NPDC002619 TaxID=3364655 RepID=UPI0036A3C7C4
MAGQGPATPVDADLGEESVLDLVPFRRSRPMPLLESVKYCRVQGDDLRRGLAGGLTDLAFC